MRTSFAIKYAIKVWLLSVLVSPAVILLFNIIPDLSLASDSIYDFLNYYRFIVFYGGLFSIPSLLIFMGVVYVLTRSNKEKRKEKINIQIVAIILCIAPIYLVYKLLGIDFGEFMLPLGSVYLATISFGIWFFDYEKSPLSEEQEILDHLVE